MTDGPIPPVPHLPPPVAPSPQAAAEASVAERSVGEPSIPVETAPAAARTRTRRPRPWRSVRWRITLVATALVGITLAVAAYLLVTAVERRLTDRARADASSALDTTAGELEAGQSIERITGFIPGGPYLQIFGPGGKEVMPSGSGAQLFVQNARGDLVPVSGIAASRFAVVTRGPS